MPMTVVGLAAKMEADIVAAKGPPTDPMVTTEFAFLLAKSIVEYIQDNATVVGTVTSGAGAGGNVTGDVT